MAPLTAKFLFDTNTDGGYRLLFGDENGVWEALTEEEFKLLAGSWFICEHVQAVWNKGKVRRLAEGLPETKNALERRWMVYFVVGELLRNVYPWLQCADQGLSCGVEGRGFFTPKLVSREDNALGHSTGDTV